MATDPKAPRKRKEYLIPPGTKEGACRSCHARIYWIEPRPGVRLPVDRLYDLNTGKLTDSGTSHFETCPDAANWSKGKRQGKPPEATEAMDVRSCARCGGDHGRLMFFKLGRPAKDFQWWTMCPVTSEPILMRSKAVADAQ